LRGIFVCRLPFAVCRLPSAPKNYHEIAVLAKYYRQS